MKTESINNPTGKGKENKEGKSNDTLKKGAAMAGAAGLGVAGTMAAEEFLKEGGDDHHEDDIAANEQNGAENHAENAQENAEEAHVETETPQEFDPNDIRLEEVAEAEITDEPIDAELVAQQIIDEGGPITIENTEDYVVEIEPEVEVIDVNVDPVDIEIVESMYGGPGGEWENMDPEDYLSDDLTQPDIMDDILDA